MRTKTRCGYEIASSEASYLKQFNILAVAMDALRELQKLVKETGAFLAILPDVRVDLNKYEFDCWDVIDLAIDRYDESVVAWDRTPEGAVRKARAKLKKEVSLPVV